MSFESGHQNLKESVLSSAQIQEQSFIFEKFDGMNKGNGSQEIRRTDGFF